MNIYQARTLCRKVDDLYYTVYRELCALQNIHPSGHPVSIHRETMEECEKHVSMRLDQIRTARIQIKELTFDHKTQSALALEKMALEIDTISEEVNAVKNES